MVSNRHGQSELELSSNVFVSFLKPSFSPHLVSLTRKVVHVTIYIISFLEPIATNVMQSVGPDGSTAGQIAYGRALQPSKINAAFSKSLPFFFKSTHTTALAPNSPEWLLIDLVMSAEC